MQIGNLGNITTNPRGAWDLSTEYKRLDVVSYLGNMYIAKKDSQGVTPDTEASEEYWMQAVKNIDVENAGFVTTNDIVEVNLAIENISNTQQETSASIAELQAELEVVKEETGKRFLGELVHSLLPQEDAGLHLLDGSALAVGGVYNDFISHVTGLQESYPQIFLTEDEWQKQVSTYKSCGKFVYQEAETRIYYAFYNETSDAYVYTRALYEAEAESNDVNVYDSSFAVIGTGTLVEGGTLTYEEAEYTYSGENNLTREIEPYLRLPKVSDIIQGTTDISQCGGLVEAGLPNIAGGIRLAAAEGTAVTVKSTSGAFSFSGETEDSFGMQLGYASGNWGVNVSFNASLSNPIYGNSETVQPQTIKGLLYMVVATSAKTDIQVDIDKVATDLGNKADRDLTNTKPSQSFKEMSIGWWMPDYSAGIELERSLNLNYTAPCDGFFVGFFIGIENKDCCFKVNGQVAAFCKSGASSVISQVHSGFFVQTGDVITNENPFSTADPYFYVRYFFYPLKGVVQNA